MRVDVHKAEKRLKKALERLTEIEKENRERIIEFYHELVAKGYSKLRIEKYLRVLRKVLKLKIGLSNKKGGELDGRIHSSVYNNREERRGQENSEGVSRKKVGWMYPDNRSYN